MRKIPLKLRDEMESDSFYKQCCITGRNDEKIEWHHNLIYGGQQVNEKFCILPLTDWVHREIVKHKQKCDWIMWSRASEQEIEKYSKATNYKRELERLNKIYGTYTNRKSTIN